MCAQLHIYCVCVVCPHLLCAQPSFAVCSVPSEEACIPVKSIVLTDMMKKLWRKALGFQGDSLSQEAIRQAIATIFEEIDGNKDGSLDPHELIAAFAERLDENCASGVLDQMIKSLDGKLPLLLCDAVSACHLSICCVVLLCCTLSDWRPLLYCLAPVSPCLLSLCCSNPTGCHLVECQATAMERSTRRNS